MSAWSMPNLGLGRFVPGMHIVYVEDYSHITAGPSAVHNLVITERSFRDKVSVQRRLGGSIIGVERYEAEVNLTLMSDEECRNCLPTRIVRDIAAPVAWAMRVEGTNWMVYEMNQIHDFNTGPMWEAVLRYALTTQEIEAMRTQ